MMQPVFDFALSPVPVRDDLKLTYRQMWEHFASPGPTMDAAQRSALLAAARSGRSQETARAGDSALKHLGATLYADPAAVTESTVRDAADEAGDAGAAETVGLVAMLSAVDGAHRALGVELEPLPTPLPGPATENITRGLKRRRTHLPMPSGAIPSALDLVPEVATAYRASFGPQYMTESDMAFSDFARTPGLNRAQIELVSSRTSFINECFY
jgi:hypothetical protein